VLSYEWDAAKNTENLTKHEIDFADAVLIFDRPVVEAPDRRKDYGEERITAIGIANGVELFVVYTPRRNNRRIISARRASRP
jgi:uncharacterized protein